MGAWSSGGVASGVWDVGFWWLGVEGKGYRVQGRENGAMGMEWEVRNGV